VTGTEVKYQYSEEGEFQHWRYINGHFKKLLKGKFAPVLCVDGGHMKATEMKGFTLLCATVILANGRTCALSYMLCKGESNENLSIFMEGIQSAYPHLFDKSTAPCPLTIFSDRGAANLSVFPHLPNVVHFHCAWHLAQ
jgi:hypothetical protein